jgi:hypothetical protein
MAQPGGGQRLGCSRLDVRRAQGRECVAHGCVLSRWWSPGVGASPPTRSCSPSRHERASPIQRAAGEDPVRRTGARSRDARSPVSQTRNSVTFIRWRRSARRRSSCCELTG